MSAPTQTNVLAIVSLITGILSILTSCFCYGFPFNLIGGILGVVALVQISADSTQGGKGLAIGGIVCSALSIVVAIGIVVMSFGMLAAMENL